MPPTKRVVKKEEKCRRCGCHDHIRIVGLFDCCTECAYQELRDAREDVLRLKYLLRFHRHRVMKMLAEDLTSSCTPDEVRAAIDEKMKGEKA